MSADGQLDIETWILESTVERDFKRPGTSSRAAAYAAAPSSSYGASHA